MNTSTHIGIVVCLLLVSGFLPALTQGAQPDVTVENVTYSGSGNVSVADTGLYLWQSKAHEFTATVSTTGDVETNLCLVAAADTDAERELACKPVTLSANTTESTAIPVSEWPSDLNGSQRADFVLRGENESSELARESLEVTVLHVDGDLDDDGLPNEREASLGTALLETDTDGDNLTDGLEAKTHETSPANPDTDGDGLADGAEVETHGTDPTVSDSDDDGLPDARELEVGTNLTNADTDGDGLADGQEVNTYETDPTAADTDEDGLDDRAEIRDHETNPTDSDTDEDGLDDNLEVNTYGTDLNAVDSDDDGLDDGAEVNTHDTDPADADTDGDGLDDGAEVNSHDTNPTNADTDGDGLDDGPEVNRYGTDPSQVDSDNDGQSDDTEVAAGRFPVPRGWMAGGAVVILFAGGGLIYWSDRQWVSTLRQVLGRQTDVTSQSPDERANEPSGETDGQSETLPPELLSNEDQIMALLDEHDGQMRQADIVEETGWSKSKVSRVLSEMAADGSVVKINVGRGNLVSRPEDLPSAAKSPFEE